LSKKNKNEGFRRKRSRHLRRWADNREWVERIIDLNNKITSSISFNKKSRIKKENVILFIIEVEAKSSVLNWISRRLRKYNASLSYVSFFTPNPKERIVRVLAFVNVTDAGIVAEEIKEELQKISYVENVKVISPVKNNFFIKNSLHGIQIMSDRAIMFSKPGYEGLLRDIRRHFGTAGEAFLYYAGFCSGLKYGEAHKKLGKILGIIDVATLIDKLGANIFSWAGLGRIELVNIDISNTSVTLRLYDSFECELGLGSRKPYSQFIRGIFAGYLTSLFSKEMKAEEVRCIAMGDPYCEFIVKTKESRRKNYKLK